MINYLNNKKQPKNFLKTTKKYVYKDINTNHILKFKIIILLLLLKSQLRFFFF